LTARDKGKKLLELEYALDANWYEPVNSTVSPTFALHQLGGEYYMLCGAIMLMHSIIQLPNGNGNTKFSLVWTT